MNMDMGHHGTPWLDQPVLLHSSRQDICKLTKAQCEYRHGHWRYWFQADHVYALATVYFMCATIGVFAIARFISKLTDSTTKSKSFLGRWMSIPRYAEYKTFKVLGRVTPALGILLLIAAGSVYFIGLSLGPKPYYWPNTKTVSYGGSPPLATRTGWMAVALLPFVVALSSKANCITALTGVPHEKLQVYHQVASWAMFVLALVHTFPFIIVHIGKGDMVKVWNTSVVYWTGVAALIPQVWLTLMSWGPIRNRYYEFFKSMHLIAAIVFVIFFFIHCDFRMSSWDYFIATGAVYLATLIYSQVRTYFLYGLSHHARLTIVEGDMLKIAIPVHPPEKSPLKFSWTPGQHVFIRFLTLGPHALTSHPFSICSLPPQKSGNEKNKLEDAEIVLYVKPIGGLTARLAKLASKFPNILVPIMLDGPYGGLTIKTFAKFDKVIIVAGGSGAGFTLPLIKDILRRQHQEGESASPKTQIHVILSTRNHALKLWYQKEITQLTHLILPSENALGLLTTSIHVTNISTTTTTDHPSIHSTSSTEQIETGKGPTISPSSSTPTSTTEGRPDLHAQITSATSTPGVAVGIAMCGPASMFHDVKNAAAEAQVRVLRGVGAREVYLHSENFGW